MRRHSFTWTAQTLRFGVTVIALCALIAVARAETPVEITGVANGLRDEIRGVLPERSAPETVFDGERLAAEAADRARAFLRSEGYYAALVEPRADEDPPRASIVIEAGPVFTLRPPALEFKGDPPIEEAKRAALEALSILEPGAPARAAAVLAAESAAVAALRANGYPEAEPSNRRLVVDHALNAMSPRFIVQAGPRVRLGDVRLADANDPLRESYVEKLTGWERGQPYSPDDVADVRRGLASTGAFSIVTADLAERDGPDGLRDVIVDVEPAERRVMELGAGWSTTEGVGLEAEWTKRNFTRRADTLTIGTLFAEQEQSLTATAQRPNAFGANRALTLSAGILNDNTAAFERVGASVSATIDASRALQFGLSYGATFAADFYNEDVGPENAYTLSGFAEARFDETDTLFDAREGHLLTARVEPAVSFGDATTTFVRSIGEARAFHTPNGLKRVTLAARAKLGWIEPLTGDDADLPLDRRFFAGGGGSVRGYEFESISPERTVSTTPIGGRGLIEVSGEARGRITERFGAVAFVDGGSSFNTFEKAEDFLWGAGLGVRYDLGFAPLRLDVAVPLNPRDRDADFAIYLSIGQAF